MQGQSAHQQLFDRVVGLAQHVVDLAEYRAGVNEDDLAVLEQSLLAVTCCLVAEANGDRDAAEAEPFPDGAETAHMPAGFRQCLKCSRWKKLSAANFHKLARGHGGFRAHCKMCRVKKGSRAKEDGAAAPENGTEKRARIDENDGGDAGNEIGLQTSQTSQAQQVQQVQQAQQAADEEAEPLMTKAGEEEGPSDNAIGEHGAKKKPRQELPCVVCAASPPEDDTESVLIECAGCGSVFHHACGGYNDPRVAESNVDFYCPKCLKLAYKEPVDVLYNQQVTLFNRWLDMEDCPFNWQEVDGDGTCMFGALWNWLKLEPSRLDKSGFKSRASLIKRVAQRVIDLLDAKPEGDMIPEEREACLSVWNRIKSSVGELKRLWNTDALDYAWMGAVDVFPWVSICVWQFNPGEAVPVVRQRYGENRAGEEIEVLNLIYWTAGAGHYDILVRKGSHI